MGQTDGWASAPSAERWLSQEQLDLLLNADYQQAFDAQDYFSDDLSSVGHVFDIIDGKGSMRSNIRDDELHATIKVRCAQLD